MRVVNGVDNVDTLLNMYHHVYNAPEVTIRGSKCRNVHNMAVVLDGSQPIVTSFRARNLNLKYAKREWLWYLGADKFDDSIEEHATAWKKLKQPDGSYYSNYGQYLFSIEGGIMPFMYAATCLIEDRNTRRASIALLRREHLFGDNVDVVCTYAINFTIEGDALNMTVMMRSNDVVWGFTNDAFCFSQLMEFMYQIVASQVPNLVRGTYTHITNSMHVYERHYDMLLKILSGGPSEYDRVDCPRPTFAEVFTLVMSQGREGKGEYTDWLKA